MALQTIFTTGQVAKICKTAPRTVAKWMDSGRLKGYRLPGSSARRIPRHDLLTFLREYGMPVAALEAEEDLRILLVCLHTRAQLGLRELLPRDSGYVYEIADSAYEAGAHVKGFLPAVIVVDIGGVGRTESVQLALSLRKDSDQRLTTLIGLSLEDEGAPSQLLHAGFTELIQKPFDTGKLAARIRLYLTQE